jgi:hypothetical protein
MTPTGGELQMPCPSCGYDLRAGVGNVCPECGKTFDRARLGEAEIPWQSRRESSRLRSFWRTVWLAMWRPKRLAQQAARPVDLRAARRFQMIACLLLFPCLAVPVIAIAIPHGPELFLMFVLDDAPWLPKNSLGAWAADVVLIVLPALLLLPWLWLATGVPSYFFHPRRLDRPLQDRAIAFSYYASAPLVFLAFAAMLFVLAALVPWVLEVEPDGLLYLLWWPGLIEIIAVVLAGGAMLFTLGAVVLLLYLPWRLLRTGLNAGIGRALSCVATTCLAWPVLFVAVVVVPTLLVLYLQIAWHAVLL